MEASDQAEQCEDEEVNGPPAERKATAGPAFRLTALAATALGTDSATFVVVDGHLQGVLATTRSGRGSDGTAEALSELVADRGQPVLVEDVLHSDEPAAADAEGPGSFLGVPMWSPNGSVVGVLYLMHSTPRTYTDDDVTLLADFAAVAADQLDLTRRANELEAPGERGAAALVTAIGHGEIVPWYQPIVDLSTGRLVALEALARWLHPSGTLDSPAVFIPLAERSHLIADLDRVVIGQAMGDLSRWQQQHPALRVSVNLSGRHLDTDDWVQAMQALAATAEVDPRTVTLELTETARPSSAGMSTDPVTAARAAGFQVWFDDFGSGWAALQELASFPLDGIKIDRSFAAQLGRHVDDTIIRAMATAADQLDLTVTMEGVETTEQAAMAAQLGCHYGQGYLWSRPVPASRVDRMLDTDDGALPLLG